MPGASLREVKTAFRKLAFELHPDRNKAKDAENKFKEINEAYQILTGRQPIQVPRPQPTVVVYTYDSGSTDAWTTYSF